MASLPKISPETIKAYQEEILKNSSSATFKRKTTSLKKFFNWAEEKGKIEKNPLQPEISSVVISTITPKRKIGFRTWATVGLTGTMAVLIFLLISRLKLPIPFKINFAQESAIQTTNNISQVAPTPGQTASGPESIPANGAVIAGWNLYAKLKFD